MANSNGTVKFLAEDDGWNHFIYKSNSGRYDEFNGQRSYTYYTHWVPEDPKRLLPQELPDDQNLLPDFYKKFDTLLHVTKCENVVSILKKSFEPRPVGSNSVVNSETELLDVTKNPIEPRPLHPLRKSKVIWYGAGNTSDLRNPGYTVERYGNVVFSMRRLEGYEGIIRDDLKFYFIEVIEYSKKSACRILVSHKDYPGLRSYDPYTIGGPLYIDPKKQLYYTSRLKRSDGKTYPNDLEIMKEETFDWMRYDYYHNHHVSFCKCTDEKYDIDKEMTPSLVHLVPYILKLAIVLAIWESKYMNGKQLSLITPFENTEDRDNRLKSELERVHNEAVQKLQRGEEEELDIENIKRAINTPVVERLMDKVDIVDSYLDLLKQFPERSRATLKDTLWEEIVKVLSPCENDQL